MNLLIFYLEFNNVPFIREFMFHKGAILISTDYISAYNIFHLYMLIISFNTLYIVIFVG